ncbi:PLP-dependent aminotransferase family protein [Nocardioides abyssi]|uniref:PLP-dependent aminotransferase family protein n=1 Tax=Nocardioides abyssi TaxID=3058370 RepID=A0ABT8EYG3_9ACTN|nr:PLP-dependent aminotransferase family protein [Nocardioides abyssi]MDN4163228.1 PLP-dependent aminotransferase family protein [Nocardioides abyssi]
MNDGSSARIVQVLRDRIRTTPPGSRLPSTRELVLEHAASPVTVQQALRVLTAEGLVETRPGVGTFVRAQRSLRAADHGWQTGALGAPRAVLPRVAGAMRVAPEGAVALHSGYPESGLLPERLVRSALARAARGSAATTRPPAAGLPDLRAWFAADLAAATPADRTAPTAADVVVVPGTQSGLTTVFRALVPLGGPLLVESPTYWGAVLAAAQAGVRAVPVTGDADGLDPDELDRALRATGARAVYAQPTWANPTGVQWSAERSAAVLDVVRRHGAFLVEDDWAHDLGIDADPRPLAAQDDGGHVVHVRSLTKSVSPAVRVGALVARGPVRERLLADRGAESLYTSGVLQQAALEVVTDPGWRTHLRRLRPRLRERRDLLVAALREHAPAVDLAVVPTGGLHLWCRLPDGSDVGRVVATCEARGVWVAPGDEWFPTEPTAAYLRLSFTGDDTSGYAAAARVLQETVGG